MRYPIDKPKITIEDQIGEMDNYAFLVLKCDETIRGIKFLASIEAVNPSGQHLSLQDVPLITVFVIFAVLYLLLFAVWCIAILRNWFVVVEIENLLYA